MTNTKTEGERLVALETKMDIVIDNQKIQSQNFVNLNTKLDALLPTYATIEQLEAMKRRNTLLVWITGSFSAAFGSVLTFLIVFFLQNIGG